MSLYYCKPPNIVVSIHSDAQLMDPVAAYGVGSYVIVDHNGPAPAIVVWTDPTNPDITIPQGYVYPTITAQMQSDSVKVSCQFRIEREISGAAQRNINSYIAELQTKQIGGGTLTAAEQADVDTSSAIWAWIGRPNGMQGAADSLIAANDLEWYQDVKWPPWNSTWDQFVDRF
jgi:hypothetical protein